MSHLFPNLDAKRKDSHRSCTYYTCLRVKDNPASARQFWARAERPCQPRASLKTNQENKMKMNGTCTQWCLKVRQTLKALHEMLHSQQHQQDDCRSIPEADMDIPRYANPTRSGAAAGPHLHASWARTTLTPRREPKLSGSRMSLRRSPPTPIPFHACRTCAPACFWKVGSRSVFQGPQNHRACMND